MPVHYSVLVGIQRRALRAHWDKYKQQGPGFSFFPNREKTIFLVKGKHHGIAQDFFCGHWRVHSNIWMQILGRLDEMRSSVQCTASAWQRSGAPNWMHWLHCGDSTTCRIHRLCQRNQVQVEIPHSNNKWTSGCFQDSGRSDQLQTSTRSHRTTVHTRLGWTRTVDSASVSRGYRISSDVRHRLFWMWSIRTSDQAIRWSHFSRKGWHVHCARLCRQWHPPPLRLEGMTRVRHLLSMLLHTQVGFSVQFSM